MDLRKSACAFQRNTHHNHLIFYFFSTSPATTSYTQFLRRQRVPDLIYIRRFKGMLRLPTARKKHSFRRLFEPWKSCDWENWSGGSNPLLCANEKPHPIGCGFSLPWKRLRTYALSEVRARSGKYEAPFLPLAVKRRGFGEAKMLFSATRSGAVFRCRGRDCERTHYRRFAYLSTCPSSDKTLFACKQNTLLNPL